MDTLFPDVSEFQPSADFAAIRKVTGAVAARILYGTRTDKCLPARIGAIRAQKFDAVIYYIFMRPPGQYTTTVAQQFAAVRQVLPELLPGEAICVDWEADTNRVTPSENDRDALLTMLDNFYAQPTVLYGSASSLSGYHGARPVWKAAYGAKSETTGCTFWQYTDGVYTSAGYAPVNWPGAGKCDTSVFHGTSQQLGAILSVKKVQQHMTLNKPACGIRATKTGLGYWIWAADGGVFAFGDAQSHGSAASLQLNAPVVGFDTTPDEGGYWLVGADGGVFAYGNAVFHGSIPALP